MSLLLPCYCRCCCGGGTSPAYWSGLRTVKQNHGCACGGELGTQLCFLLEWCLNCIIGLGLEATVGQPSLTLHHLRHCTVIWDCGFIHRNIHVDSPYEINRASDELHYTYLDTFGRPVIVAHKSNLVEQHIQDIVVSVASVCGLPEQLCPLQTHQLPEERSSLL